MKRTVCLLTFEEVNGLQGPPLSLQVSGEVRHVLVATLHLVKVGGVRALNDPVNIHHRHDLVTAHDITKSNSHCFNIESSYMAMTPDPSSVLAVCVCIFVCGYVCICSHATNNCNNKHQHFHFSLIHSRLI